MPNRKILKTATCVDEIIEWEANGETEGIDYFDYRIHAIGVESFIPTDWTPGEKLFANPQGVDIEQLKSDDGLWFEFPDGHKGIQHVLEGYVSKRKAVGAHVAKFLDILDLEVEKGNVLPNGVFYATVKKNGAPKTSSDHTMYPDHWEWEMVLDHFYEALLRSTYLNGNTFEGEFQLDGEHSVKIHIGFSTMDKAFRVTTFYPVP